MKNLVYYLFSLVFLVAIASCAKNGTDGPMGAKGEQGSQGEKGIPGTDGKMIRYGTSDPTPALGSDGDFYINTSAQTLFGPKTSSAWGTGTALKGNTGDKGDKGDPGTKGSQFLSDSTNPGDGDGSIGDFYFNTNSGSIFGPKTASGWGTGVSLLGNVNVNQGIGWVVLDEVNGNSSYWKRSLHIDGGSYNSSEPGDVGTPFVYNWWTGNFKSHSGVTLVYLDDGSVTKMTPFKKQVYKVVNNVVVMDAVLEFRFAMITTNTTGDHYIYPIIAIKSGSVNDNYLINTYVKTLKWRGVNIPATSMMNNKEIDFNDYHTVKQAFKLNQ